MSEIAPIPAVDLMGGRVVRLLRGERDAATVYGDDPLRFADVFAEQGAEWVHVVDLDGAFGDGQNRQAIHRLIRDSGMSVEVAGGVRSLEDFRRWRDVGAARVIFGTAAVETPEIVETALEEDPARVGVALDVREGRLRTRGWLGEGGEPEILAKHYAAAGARTFIHTGIERDGAMGGPDIEGALSVALASGVPTVVAGGVGETAHLTAIREAAGEAAGDRAAPIAGVILGRALYEGRLTVREAFRALR